MPRFVMAKSSTGDTQVWVNADLVRFVISPDGGRTTQVHSEKDNVLVVEGPPAVILQPFRDE